MAEYATLFRPTVLRLIQLAQAQLLAAGRIEVFRREPARERLLARGPFAVEHGEPGIVAVAPLGDDVLPERALVGEPVAQRGVARGRIERIAFPLVPPIAERIERIAGEEVLRLGA